MLIGGSLDINLVGHTKVVRFEIPAATKSSDHLNLLLKIVQSDRSATPAHFFMNHSLPRETAVEEDYDREIYDELSSAVLLFRRKFSDASHFH
jgi:hypothetical protein